LTPALKRRPSTIYRHDTVDRLGQTVEVTETLSLPTASETDTPSDDTATNTPSATSTPTDTGRATATATSTNTASGTGTATATSTPLPSAFTRTVGYRHDGLQRLIGAVESPGSSFAYSYDPAGNRTAVSVDGTPTASYSYDAADQVVGWGYDAAGNLLSDGATSYSYDALNHLTGTSATGQDSTYVYNGDGTLVSQTTNGTTTSYAQDLAAGQSQILAATTGMTTTNYLYGSDIAPLLALTGSTRTWYGLDGQGSVRQTLDDAANVLGSQSYDPYGQIESGSTLTSSFGYTGELQNTTTGAEYLRARWYQPGDAQLLGVDPALASTDQPYAYTSDDPVNDSDPSGQCTEKLGGGFADTAGLAPQLCAALTLALRLQLAPTSGGGYLSSSCYSNAVETTLNTEGGARMMPTNVQARPVHKPKFKTPQSWLIYATPGSADYGAHEPINVVITADSNMSISDIFDAVSFNASIGWRPEATGTSLSHGWVVTPELGDVNPGGGTTSLNGNFVPQTYSYREGGAVEFVTNGNHARVYPQSQGDGTTAYFIAFSEEYVFGFGQGLCAGHKGGYTPARLFHCIQHDGFNRGRDAFVQEARNHANQSTIYTPLVEFPVPVQFPQVEYSETDGAVDVPNAGSDGKHIGTDSVAYDSTVAWITVTH
jgi:RHS repeat-associated protein